jgi:uncharacterized protein (TIGR02147 family)
MTTEAVKQILKKIFEYDDYRLFLMDYFNAKKQEKPFFSQRYFAKKVGFNAHNFCTLVIQGKRNLSIDSIQKIIKGIGLKGRAAAFFENLVYLNQAQTLDDKERYFQRVKKNGKKTQFYQLHKEQFFFYEKWYYPVVRELIILADWNDDYSILSKMVRPSIAPSEAREAVQLLLNTGMVKKDEKGKYALSEEFVTSERVPDFIKKKARRDVLLKGIETIDTISPTEKYAAYSTVTMSRDLYEEVRGILEDTREQILALVAEDKKPDDVFEVVFQVFPVSDMKGKRQKSAGEDGNEP